ncbi:ABC transporter ATP-binding protein [Alkalilimnicola sp. S0819]|uniref:ABC transporter ATP-binding protein n=1 Tax=Alkalilimnicola sp. S0819 TaxID=2613922 RepID=UPI001261F3FB|nr:ABC transporter ATP-binding protein [Alkalilimnicola sp. S0819]KAB7623933.1 ABC transporter ATP-binding protein [Alkalilimnicola sp. S0819]MPQ16531.1 ATP-binding cassette domain-containing protein [Alkalilimnicola sp. S0819]
MLELQDLTVAYDQYPAVVDVSFRLPAGLIGCLLGPSGCGKTTLLRTVAGFQRPAAGEIRLAGKKVSDAACVVPPERRGVGMVFQDLALFPHLTVAENIAFGLSGQRGAERHRRVAELLELIGLHQLGGAYPHELSGGQQQRVAIARAMAPKPKLLLLDEPFSSLDPDLRAQLPRELRRIFREDGITALLVTHDQNEAFAMADQIGVMRDGALEQWDSAYRLYHEPATRFVADFVGEGVMLPGTVLDSRRVRTELGVMESDEALRPPPNTLVDILLRPDDLLHDDKSPLKARIVERSFRGGHFLYTVALASGRRVLCQADSHHDHKPDEAIGIRAELDHLVIFEQAVDTGPTVS